MAELWWRSYHGASTDHKWAVVAKRSGVKPGMVSAIVWALLDYASRNDLRGSIQGFDPEEYAVYSGFEEGEIIAVIEAMTDKGILVDYKFANWDKRQPKSEAEIERSKRNKAKANQPKTEESEIPDHYDGCNTEYYGEVQKGTESYGKVQKTTKRYARVQKGTKNYTDKEKDIEKEKELINSFSNENECEQSSRVRERSKKSNSDSEPGKSGPVDALCSFGKNRDLAESFISSSGLMPVGKEYALWNFALKQIAEAGITPEEIPRIVEYMRRERLTIGSPLSILKVGRDLKASGKINETQKTLNLTSSDENLTISNGKERPLSFAELAEIKKAEALTNGEPW